MSDLAQTIGRVRRAMPRNADVMAICDELEQRMSCRSTVERMDPITAMPAKPKLSRAEIQKNYRLRKKAKKK